MKIQTVGDFAIFHGREFHLERHSDRYWLISDDPNDMALGFLKADVKDRYVLKDVDLEQLSLVFRKVTYAYYDGHRFQVSRIVAPLIMLNFCDTDWFKKYSNQGIEVIQYDRQDYYMYVPLKDVEKIEQEWVPYEPTAPKYAI